jgi:hypothetical protein
MRSVRTVLAAVAIAAALAPLTPAMALDCPPGTHPQRFSLFGATWIACVPN